MFCFPGFYCHKILLKFYKKKSDFEFDNNSQHQPDLAENMIKVTRKIYKLPKNNLADYKITASAL